MFQNKRAALFIDVISQYYSIGTVFPGQKLNYKAYLDKIGKETDVNRAVAYGACINNEAQNFIQYLINSRYEVKYVPARKVNNRPIIKYTDRSMDIALDIIRMLDRLDVVVIGSCNLNLLPLFAFLKEKGIKVIVFACNIPREIKNVADEWIEITEDLLENKRDYTEEDEDINIEEEEEEVVE